MIDSYPVLTPLVSSLWFLGERRGEGPAYFRRFFRDGPDSSRRNVLSRLAAASWISRNFLCNQVSERGSLSTFVPAPLLPFGSDADKGFRGRNFRSASPHSVLMMKYSTNPDAVL